METIRDAVNNNNNGNCCFCVPLKLGIYIIGYSNIVISFILLNITLYYPQLLFSFATYDEPQWSTKADRQNETQSDQYANRDLSFTTTYFLFHMPNSQICNVLVEGLLLTIVKLICAIILLCGIYFNNHILVLVWLIFAIIEIMFAILSLAVSIILFSIKSFLFLIIVVLLIYSYFFAHRYYRLMKL